MEHGKTEGCLGAGKLHEKELRVCGEWFLEPGEPESHFCCPQVPYPDSFPLGATVYLSAKRDNNGYLGGMLRR